MMEKKNWQNHEAFQNLSPEKQTMILLLTESLENKQLTEALPVLMQWKQQLTAKNISFTSEENELLTQIFIENLSPAGRQQYEYLKPLIKANMNTTRH
ncbi:MAG: hypothetical protein K2K70_02250 [Lachnospiraceae bacterium]|nr:hypothetical protein [Lachnospiraceae bacterium]